MNWRWAVWTTGIALIAMLLLLPLRIALSAADLGSLGMSARQVGGTIWGGRIGELMLGRQLLGTFDVRLDPAALLLGRIAMPFGSASTGGFLQEMLKNRVAEPFTLRLAA